MALFDDVKTALRVSDGTEDYDQEINGLIYAAFASMALAGVRPSLLDEGSLSDIPASDVPSGLVKQAVIFYAKAHFGYDNQERTQFMDCFDRAVTALELSSASNVECWRVDMADCVVGEIEDQAYTGYTVRPVPSVTYGGEELSLGKDFLTAYARNVEPGTATVFVQGTGSYSGVASRKFEIVEAG